MHIIEVASRFRPAIGGMEEHVYRISLELLKRGHKVTVVTSNEADGETCPLQAEVMQGIQVYRFPLFVPRLFRELWFIPNMSSTLRRIKGDVVHAHGYRCMSSFQAAYLARRECIPVVLTPHGIYPSRSLANALLKSAFDRTFGHMLVDYSERIVALSEHNTRLLLQIGATPDKITVIPNGVRVEEYADLEKSKEILNEVGSNGPILLYVGRIDWNKQVGKVIEAMPLILKSFPSAKFVIIGPDYANYSGELSHLASRMGVKRAIVMAGRVTAERLREFYSAADIFILPSSYEGFGLSMIEAMVSRIPVIASSAGGPGDILDHGIHAWLMEVVTPEKIAESVRILLTDQQLRGNLVKNAFELVKEKYTWEKVVDKLEVVYDQVANK